MSRLCLLIVLAACQAQKEVETGPTFGGDQRSGGVVEALETGRMPSSATAAGVFSALPLAISDQPCLERLCVATRPAWLPSGELLVGMSVEGMRPRPPVDLVYSLDSSGSVKGSEDVRAATVEIALDRLDSDDSLGLWAFAGSAVELVPSASVTDGQRSEVRSALQSLDDMPDALGLVEHTCTWPEVLEIYDAQGGEGLDTGLAPEFDPELEPFYAWVDGILESNDPDQLGAGLTELWCLPGSNLEEGVAAPMEGLSDGSEQRASRLVFVSDLGGDLPIEAVEAGGLRGVGTSVLGITAATDAEGMARLAQTPGAHMLDASEPAAALASWESRFDAWMAPTSWGLTIELDERSEPDWDLVRIVGATDAEEKGASTVFPSQAHGMLGLVLKRSSTSDEIRQPHFVVSSTRLDGSDTLSSWSKIPLPLLQTDWGEGDDQVGLQLAWRVALAEAIASQDSGTWESLRDAR